MREPDFSNNHENYQLRMEPDQFPVDLSQNEVRSQRYNEAQVGPLPIKIGKLTTNPSSFQASSSFLNPLSHVNLQTSMRKDPCTSNFAGSGTSEMERELREAMQQSYSAIIHSPAESSHIFKDSLKNPSLALTSSFHMVQPSIQHQSHFENVTQPIYQTQ